MKRVVFMGTPDFAVGALDAIIQSGLNVVGVVTVPDKPAGRGKQLSSSAVKQYAEQHQLPILQPERLKAPDFLDALKTWQPDLIVVVAFRMLPEVVWNMPTYGTINLHASLLPDYKGSAPINWAIINGEKTTGVTTFFINREIDSGDTLMHETVDIDEQDDAGTLHDKLMHVGSALLVKTIRAIFENTIKAVPQLPESKQFHLAPKIFKDDCRISWHKPATEIRNFIRGLSPYPAAYSLLLINGNTEQQYVKIFKTHLLPKENGKTGEIKTDQKTYLHVCCGDQHWLSLDEIQLSGKKRMNILDFLRGFKLTEDIFFA